MTTSNGLLTAHRALANWARDMPDREFLLQPDNGELKVRTFSQGLDESRRMASALIGLGLAAGDRVILLAKNDAEWVLADLAIAMAGLVSVPIYPTANADTVAYIAGHCEARAALVGSLDDPEIARKAIPRSLPTVALSRSEVECDHGWKSLIEGAEPIEFLHEPPSGEDIMTILYTSGSTGRPKGVALSYRAYIYACTSMVDVASLDADDRAVSYLPLAHVVERTTVVGPCIYAGAKIHFVESLESFTRDVKAARPTAFGSVPRLWVKFQSGILTKIPPAKLRLLLAIPFLGRRVARKIREGLGLDQCRRFGSGSAPISPHTLQWYRKIGVDIGEGWGMTETGGLSCSNMPFRPDRLGTIGVPIDGTELKLSEAGELLIRSPGLFTEYLKQPELTAESFTDDGFFHTGDKAEWDEGCEAFRITGRVKDIFKTAKGKYVAPVPIESRLSANPLLEQICVIGTGLPAPVAVVVLGEAAQHLPRESVEESLEATRVDANAHLESHERLSNVYVASGAWTTENGMLTPTLKIKRDQLEARYIEKLGRPLATPVVWE